jgi:hypothetical protein
LPLPNFGKLCLSYPLLPPLPNLAALPTLPALFSLPALPKARANPKYQWTISILLASFICLEFCMACTLSYDHVGAITKSLPKILTDCYNNKGNNKGNNKSNNKGNNKGNNNGNNKGNNKGNNTGNNNRYFFNFVVVLRVTQEGHKLCNGRYILTKPIHHFIKDIVSRC